MRQGFATILDMLQNIDHYNRIDCSSAPRCAARLFQTFADDVHFAIVTETGAKRLDQVGGQLEQG